MMIGLAGANVKTCELYSGYLGQELTWGILLDYFHEATWVMCREETEVIMQEVYLAPL
jgi:hypothetical protein